MPSATPDVLIKVHSDGQIGDFRLERNLEPRDLLTVAEAGALVRKTGQTLRNWKRQNAAFPMKKMGGQWIVIRPYLEAFLLHWGV
ncbi:MAG TPA: hypothetical protein VHV75_14435 [Solirubrobacteraceae bacterium]|nr:hypothetical protein [Solirubrobacteraceae bacterium]